ncbi:Pseudouridine-5'-phosphate glycosidase [Serratia fonticola]|uniref:Pseudouridine-5'-phosphate glycosidase n=1 Tax=Serratia fonticola TaxID=47917 RepID=A0A4V6Z383_SERFO|nr:Pseudouridine-5'-phosphate glycosidase [Serratia fonticola]
MIIAELAGISVFATGGIGGVHRGAQQTFDISADLQELAQTNVAVICAGAKSILDLGLTTEYLENPRRAFGGVRHR